MNTIARATLAVLEEWNKTMEQIVVCRLSAPYRAWRGFAASQQSRGGDEWVIGGELQLYIPLLHPDHVKRVGVASAFFAPPRSNFSH
jgi:hypothetical protein